jgi:hypothetical protein
LQENALFWGARRLDERTRKVKTIQQRVITHKVIHKILWLCACLKTLSGGQRRAFCAARVERQVTRYANGIAGTHRCGDRSRRFVHQRAAVLNL